MPIKIGINGFGRIGRNFYRAVAKQGADMEIVAVNDLGDTATMAHLLKHDSVHGNLPNEISAEDSGIMIDGQMLQVLSERNPQDLPWSDLGVDVVIESTGIFTDREKAALHLEAGAQRVVISAPANGADLTVVYGVNHDKITSEHTVISNASCTTNCLAPVAFVLNNAIGIESGYMTTIHAFTSDQPTLDTYHGDLHRARSAATSMIPTSTGAAKAVGLVMPELLGKLDGTAIRVPTSNVSLIDFKFIPNRTTTIAEVNEAIISASEKGSLKGVLGINKEPLVSVDFNHNPHSSTFDLNQTQVIDGGLVRVLSWYDNEWGFSNRMSDTAAIVAKTL